MYVFYCTLNLFRDSCLLSSFRVVIIISVIRWPRTSNVEIHQRYLTEYIENFLWTLLSAMKQCYFSHMRNMRLACVAILFSYGYLTLILDLIMVRELKVNTLGILIGCWPWLFDCRYLIHHHLYHSLWYGTVYICICVCVLVCICVCVRACGCMCVSLC